MSNNSSVTTPLGALGDPPEVPPTVSDPFTPIALIDVDLTITASVVVDVPVTLDPAGPHPYRQSQQLHLRHHPWRHRGPLDVTDGCDTGPNSVKVGFVGAVVQHKFWITSTMSGIATSVAIVQVNQNGAYAVNSWIVQ